MSKFQEVFGWIDDSRDEIIRLQTELTSRPAIGPGNGGSGEHEKAAFLKEEVTALGADVIEEVRAPDPRAKDGYRPNLICRWKGNEGERKVWILSHMDIVPPGDLSLWKSDPFKLRVEGDRLIGRGVQDDQHGIVSSLLALKAIRETGLRPGRSVGLVFLADEESGSRYGLQYLLEQRREYFDPRDLIVVPDAGNEEGTLIEVAEKSVLWLKVTVNGRQCHASTPEKGINSLVGAARLILALHKGLKERYDFSDDLFKPPYSTFEPTKMEANVPNVNTLPGKDIFYLDCRVLPHYGPEEILTAAREIAAQIAESTGLSVQIDAVQKEKAADPTPEDAPVVRELVQSIRVVSGKRARPMGIGGATVASLFRNLGFPAAVWMTAPDTAHQPNEFCLISDIMFDAKVFACLYLNEFGPAGP
ncbi:MAG: M20 family metallo-hydrolase [Deltaproteobacteria bacterium]|nr:M20 family metallo-hydrolase [Deltaproteobacteria bacterium]